MVDIWIPNVRLDVLLLVLLDIVSLVGVLCSVFGALEGLKHASDCVHRRLELLGGESGERISLELNGYCILKYKSVGNLRKLAISYYLLNYFLLH